MEPVKINDLVRAVNGRAASFGERTFQDVSTDSRTVREGEVFFAIAGERLNGHAYVSSALERGAAAAVVAEDRPEWPSERVIRVPDTTAALLDFAAWYRRGFDVRPVAVTGSVGKTTTKEMVAAVLSADGPTLKTQGNQNNEIGLPKTLLSLNRKHKYAVIEMGMTGLHQIDSLSEASCPEIGLITNIGVSHLETLHTRENILRAKLEICAGIPDGGTLIVNADNDLLGTVRTDRLRLFTYGMHSAGADVRILRYQEEQAKTSLTLCWEGREYDAEIPCIGEHNVYNAAAAFAAGVRMGIPAEKVIPALLTYEPTGMRQRMVQFHNMLIVEDCYNAAPDSMQAALRTLSRLGTGRKIAVFADMLELGPVSEESHAALGTWTAASGTDMLLCYGPRTGKTVLAAREAGMKEAYHFDSKDELTLFLTAHAREGDCILVKGSRSMALEDVLHNFYAAK